MCVIFLSLRRTRPVGVDFPTHGSIFTRVLFDVIVSGPD